MSKYSRLIAWGMVGLYLVQILACIFAGHYLLSLQLSIGTILLMVMTSLFIGTRLRGLNNIVHECSHSTFAENRDDNVAIGRFCASLLVKCFKQYKEDHLSHHSHLGDYTHDREMGPIERFGLHEKLSPKTVLRLIATPMLGHHLKMYSGINLSNGDGRFFFGLKTGLLISIVGFAVFAPYTALFFAVLPLFYIFPTVNFWTDCLDHAGIMGSEDGLEASRNILAPLPLRLLFFPRNDSFHLVHHLFPQVPARHLKSAHLTLCEESSYSRNANAVRDSQGTDTRLASELS
ncbi:MAG: fatty acid desaturase [Paracoccaceae bacterium]